MATTSTSAGGGRVRKRGTRALALSAVPGGTCAAQLPYRVLRITGHERLLAPNPVLERTLSVRNAYLAPLHFLQVVLTERLRADRAAGREPDPAVARALLLSVNGIAAGMRNTG